MAEKLTTFVWRHSAREQLLLLALTLCSFPVIWITLELPKIIINEAIGGTEFPKVVLGFELEQIQYLVALCFAYLAAVALNNGLKYITNMQRGILGERLLRRMRFDLFRRVMGRPLSRLRTTSPGELVQMISAELERVGDFVGAIITTPISQGGSFLVYLAFIIVQNPLLGAATLVLYPMQAWLVPKLQSRVVAMIRARLINIRAMAREIEESVDSAAEVQSLAARRWHMAIVSRQLYENYKIRRRIFILKFLIKFVNNVANHVTPFFIFLIGGWFVIEGELDIGALTAVLIAYKDLAQPWKELLRYYQEFSDMSSRYRNVMEQFLEDGEPQPLLEEAPTGPHALQLEGASVDGLAGRVSVHVPRGATVAVAGGDAHERTALLQALSGLTDNLQDVWKAGTPVLYRAAVYVPPDPTVFTGSIRANLLQGLRFRPVAPGEDDERELRVREAKLTGAPPDDLDDQWIAPEEAGYESREAVEARMLELAAALGLEEDLYDIGLNVRVDPAVQTALAGQLLELRERIAEDEELGAMREDFIDVWREDAYNPNASVGENLFFALPRDPKLTWSDFADDREVLRALDHAEVRGMLVEMGVDICETLLSLFEGISPDSDLFKRYGLFPRAETPMIENIIRRARQKGALRLNRAEQSRMIAIAFSYSSARYRLGVMRTSDRIHDLLAAREKLADLPRRDDRFARFDHAGFHPAFSIAENIFFGPVKIDRRDSWQPFKSRVDDLVSELGVRDLILRAGIDQPVGEGGRSLNAQQRRRLGLARALMKNPLALVIDQIAATDSDTDQALRALLRREVDARAPGGAGALVYAAAGEAAAETADQVMRIDSGGRVTQESQGRAEDESGRAAPGRR
jgi:putative ABC transport system ATP-binding protein